MGVFRGGPLGTVLVLLVLVLLGFRSYLITETGVGLTIHHDQPLLVGGEAMVVERLGAASLGESGVFASVKPARISSVHRPAVWRSRPRARHEQHAAVGDVASDVDQEGDVEGFRSAPPHFVRPSTTHAHTSFTTRRRSVDAPLPASVHCFCPSPSTREDRPSSSRRNKVRGHCCDHERRVKFR